MEAYGSPSNGLQSDLFQLDSPIDWLAPTETVFSLASRFHLLSGNIDHKLTSRQLFGATRGGHPHDLPGGLARFSEVFGGRLGSVEEIIRSRTALPFLLAYKTEEDRANACSVVAQGSIGSLKSALGLIASRFGASLPLKACAACMKRDREEYGVPLWHIEHQLPGVWICQQHGVVLSYSTSKQSGQARYQWLLPDQDDLKEGWIASASTPATAATDFLKKIANAVEGIHRLSKEEPMCPQRTALALRGQLANLRLAAASGRIRQRESSAQFCGQMRCVHAIRELSSIASTESSAYAQIMGLLSAHDGGCHPLRVATAVAWLFGSWVEFLEKYKVCGMPEQTSAVEGVVERVLDPRRKTLLGLIHKGASVTSAAKEIGVQVATAQAWAAQAGVGVSKRPSAIRGGMRDAAIAALRKGEDKRDIEEAFGVSPSSVNRLMRTEVGLHRDWVNARLKRSRETARNQWKDALNQCSGVKAARLNEQAAYAWLYRNDRAWLADVNRIAETVPRSNNPSVDWGKRDLQFVNQVQRAILAIRARRPKGRISVADVFCLVPDLKAKYRRIGDLPRTRSLLSQACMHSPRDSGDSNLL